MLTEARLGECKVSTPLRVLHIGKFYPPHKGGMESHLQVLCEELSHTISPSVVVANDGRSRLNETVAGIPVSRLGTKLTLAAAPLCPDMIGCIRDADVDLIHVHLPNPGAVLAYLASGHKGPLVVTYHSDTPRQRILSKLFEPLLHRFLSKASAILVTSANYLETSSVLRKHRERCRIVPLGIRLGEFTTCDSGAARRIREKYGNRIILAVGRLVYYKGFNHLVEAMAKVDGHLLLIGEGPLRAELEQLTRACGSADRVHFLGMVSSEDFPPYYHAVDAFVLPSVARSEAFGIVQIEAMAAGLPVINTQLDSGVPFVSLHGVTGLTVPPGDSAALASAINLVLTDAALRAQYGAAARVRATEMFSAETMTNQTLDAYRATLGLSPEQLTRDR